MGKGSRLAGALGLMIANCLLFCLQMHPEDFGKYSLGIAE
jgi:hypothetical protein